VWLWRQFQIYGSRIRPAPNLVLFCDPEAYADIYSMKSNVRRSNFYTALRINDLDAHTLNTVDVAEHAAKRRILNVCFSEKSVRAASKFIIQHVDRWNQLMLEEPVDSEGWSAPVDLTEKLTQLVFDITGDLSFGTSFNTKEPGDNPLKEIPHSIAEAMQFVYPVISLIPFCQALLSSPLSDTFSLVYAHGIGFTNGIVDCQLSISQHFPLAQTSWAQCSIRRSYTTYGSSVLRFCQQKCLRAQSIIQTRGGKT
jgi:hypothetical protein